MLFILLNLNFVNINYLIDSVYIYILNQLINLKLNIIILILILFIIVVNLNINFNKIYTVFIIYFFIEYFSLGKDFKDYIYDLNTNLINGFFLIHPILIYIYYSLLTVLLILVLLNIYNFDYKNNIINFKLHYTYILNKYISYLLYIILLAIFLGS